MKEGKIILGIFEMAFILARGTITSWVCRTFAISRDIDLCTVLFSLDDFHQICFKNHNVC